MDHVAIPPGMLRQKAKTLLTKFVLAQRPQLVVIGAGSAGMACCMQRNLMQVVLKDAMQEHERRNNDGRRGGSGGECSRAGVTGRRRVAEGRLVRA